MAGLKQGTAYDIAQEDLMPTDKKAVRISRLTFHHYKAFERYSLSLDHMNILTGSNNSGKSTIVGALRALAVALRSARSRQPERVRLGDHRPYGYHIKQSLLPISLENVATNYQDGDSRISFHLTNGNQLTLVFEEDGGCILLPESPKASIGSASAFRTNFPIELAVVPVLGPVEHEEVLREPETVLGALATHRASRHFRSYWYHFPDQFELFAELVANTWPGMSVSKPRLDLVNRQLRMFVAEDRIDRELYWVGFGFQVWCQLLTHIQRTNSASLIVIDEPEVYLHPDVQRRLLSVLREVGPDVLVATHSTEIIAEADPGEVVLIDKRKLSAERLKDIAGVQRAMTVLGSQQNISLTALARNRRVLFVEGDDDFRIIKRFAKRCGLSDLALGLGLAAMPSGGFKSWQRITVLAEGVGQALGTELMIAAVYDRDFLCDEEIQRIEDELKRSLTLAHIHKRKEIENYLLVPAALDRAIEKALQERAAHGARIEVAVPRAADLLDELTEDLREDAEAQYVSKHCEFFKRSGRDAATLTKEALARFRPKWALLEGRTSILSGKDILRRLRQRLSTQLGVTLTDARIIDAMLVDDIPIDLRDLLSSLNDFRRLRA